MLRVWGVSARQDPEYRQYPEYPTPKYLGAQAISAIRKFEILKYCEYLQCIIPRF